MGCSIVNHPFGGTPIYGTSKSNQLVSGSSQEDLEEKVVQILTQVASATQMQGPSRVQQGHFCKKKYWESGNMSRTASYDESYVICNDSINVMQLLLIGRI